VPKVLAKAGDSLADVYDVEGSIAGVDELITRDVTTFHEMGGTIFSERISGNIRRLSTGALAQNATFDLTITDLPASVSRILNMAIVMQIGDLGSRVGRATVAIRSAVQGREVPVYVWDNALDSVASIRIVDDGGAAGNTELLRPATMGLMSPGLLQGTGQPQVVSDIAFRGTINGFGAGTVELILLFQLAFSQIEGVSSRGLPVPSW